MNEEDAELQELRQRRLAQLMTRPKEQAPPATAAVEPVQATTSTFSRVLSENPRLVVDVWAPWCGPCRYLSPTVDALAKDLAGQVRFAKLNADEEPAIAGQFGVEAIPTLLYFDHGRLVDRTMGVMAKEMLLQRVLRAFHLPGAGAPPSGYA